MRSPAHLTQDAYLKKKFHLDTAWTINIYAQRVAHLDRRKDKESRVVDSFKIKRESFHLFFLFGICDVIGPRPQPGNLRQSIKTTSRLLFFFWYEIHLHLYKRWASQEQSLSPFPPPFLSSIIGFEAEREQKHNGWWDVAKGQHLLPHPHHTHVCFFRPAHKRENDFLP
jgi:hypothetical protein